MIRALSIAGVVLPLLAAVAPPALPLAAIAEWTLSPEQELQAEQLAAQAIKWRIANPVRNWGGGSCVHAAIVNLLHWQEQHELADWWRSHHAGGESPLSLMPQLEQSGIRWAQTTAGDESFLEWAISTRRGCGTAIQVPTWDGRRWDAGYPANHMVCLVGMDSATVSIFDSNDPGKIAVRDRAEFLANWHRSGGWAITPVYMPPAPQPWRIRKEGDE